MAPKPSFARNAMPFLVMISFGSWGLSQFLRLPTQLKDENRRRKKEGRTKFNLEQENEVRGPARHPVSESTSHARPPYHRRSSLHNLRLRRPSMRISESQALGPRGARLQIETPISTSSAVDRSTQQCALQGVPILSPTHRGLTS